MYIFDTFGAADHSARLMNPRSFFLMKASFRRKKLAYSADERRRRRRGCGVYIFLLVVSPFAFPKRKGAANSVVIRSACAKGE